MDSRKITYFIPNSFRLKADAKILKKEPFSFFNVSNEKKQKIKKSNFTLLSLNLPQNVKKINLKVLQNDCLNIKYVLAKKDDINIQKLDSQESLFLLQMSRRAFRNNPNWQNLNNIETEMNIDIPSISSPYFYVICPSWKSSRIPSFEFEMNLHFQKRVFLKQARLLAESNKSVPKTTTHNSKIKSCIFYKIKDI